MHLTSTWPTSTTKTTAFKKNLKDSLRLMSRSEKDLIEKIKSKASVTTLTMWSEEANMRSNRDEKKALNRRRLILTLKNTHHLEKTTMPLKNLNPPEKTCIIKETIHKTTMDLLKTKTNISVTNSNPERQQAHHSESPSQKESHLLNEVLILLTIKYWIFWS